MILQAKHFIHSPCASIRRDRKRERDVTILIPSTVCNSQTDRPKDLLETRGIYLLPLLLHLLFFFLLLQSECKGCRNEEGTSVHNSKTSSPSVLSPPDCSVFVSPHDRRSPLFSSSFSLLSSQSERGEKEFSERILADAAHSAHPCRILLLFCFEPRPDDVPCFERVLSSSSRFVSSRLYRSRVRDQNWPEISTELRASDGILPWSTISRQERIVYSASCHQRKLSRCHELKNNV